MIGSGYSVKKPLKSGEKTAVHSVIPTAFSL
jgi:hypothetical protein